MTQRLVEHLKSGKQYLEIMRGLLEADLTPVVIYRLNGGGEIWVRTAAEFDDGRFVDVTP